MTPWDSACLALRLLAIDPVGLGGIAVRARVGPARDAFTAIARQLPGERMRLHPGMDLKTLSGGIDVAASLAKSTLVRVPGLLEGQPKRVEVAMAERSPALLTSHLAAALDRAAGHVVIAFDEGADKDETCPPALLERLAFHVSLEDIACGDLTHGLQLPSEQRLRNIRIPHDACEALIVLASDLGINSMRAPLFALTAAKAHAALNMRETVLQEDLSVATVLVFGPRATRLPQAEENAANQSEPPPPDPRGTEDSGPVKQTLLDQDLLLEAIKATLPDNLLDRLSTGTNRQAAGSGAGKKRIGNRRGRPLPPRNAGSRGATRVDIMATLRAAIPWQTLRRQAQPERTGALIKPSDLRYKRYQEQSDRLLIFAVDASGSAALARLGEAKGAVELLLGEAYARRDHVALITFRGGSAEVLLPPTRSLVQTKRRLADLPGGGGTPLAAGLAAALHMAEIATKKGLTPTLVLLTDGRSNIALDGSPDRARAGEDAMRMADELAAIGLPSIVIDTGVRPEKTLKCLSETLCGHYVSLPRADAKRLSEAVSGALVA